MRKIVMMLSLFVAAMTHAAEQPKRVSINTPHMSVVVEASADMQPRYVYLGDRINQQDVDNAQPVSRTPIYPTLGSELVHESALAITHADGSMATDLRYVDTQTVSEGSTTVTKICMQDKVYPVTVNVCYRAYKDVDVIETWTEIVNNEKRPITLNRYASAMLPIRKGNVWMTSFHGAWGNEAGLVERQLQRGFVTVKNKNGIRNSQTEHAEVMFSLDGRAAENSGRVIGAALCYTGNYRLQVETYNTGYHYLLAGIDEECSPYHLARGESFVTPVLAFTYSTEGKGGVSRTFHRWGREYKLCHGNQLRDVLLNSWEGVGMNVKEEEMNQMMAAVHDLGGELFVMDDGWFGSKYPRNNDSAGLGDWVTDTKKLPGGIDALLADAKNHNIKFGIWIEPEMANIKSELYERHPDWIINAKNRPLVGGRGGNQLVLDLANPKVQDFVFGVVDDLLSRYPQIAYIKWDANMSIVSHGSQYLSAADQSHLYIAYHQGLKKVLERIRAKYPDVVMQSCASGGGRVNWGILPYFDEWWVSDNTDALQRIFMQWGTSHFFPAIGMASHVSKSPNQQTRRLLPLKYRFDVAMSGRLGMEMVPSELTESEQEFARKAIADYKTIRPIVQLGDLYRLVSPYDNSHVASLMYVSDTKDRAVFYWWKLAAFVDDHLPRITMAGLNPDRVYTIHELNRIDRNPLSCEGRKYTGAYLMNHGIDLPSDHDVRNIQTGGWSSRVLYLVAE